MKTLTNIPSRIENTKHNAPMTVAIKMYLNLHPLEGFDVTGGLDFDFGGILCTSKNKEIVLKEATKEGQ